MVIQVKEQTDIVIIGSGLGGLSCGALLARYGFEVVVCESHSLAGAASEMIAAHSLAPLSQQLAKLQALGF